MRVLLDTCVLSELYKTSPLDIVKDYIYSLSDSDIYLSAITIGEIRKGISLLDMSKRRDSLENWLNELQINYSQRILSIDSETSIIWGDITASAKKKGFTLTIADGLIAATAIKNSLHIITRNVKDFEFTGVLLTNPWKNY